MTKFKALFLSCAAAVTLACAVIFSGCGFTPEEGSKYYKVDDICRVIELDESKTRTVEDYAIKPLTVPFEAAALTPVSVTIQYYFYKNSLFFETNRMFNKDAALCVYDCIGIDRHSEVTDDDTFTGYYTTYNAVYATEEVHKFEQWDKPNNVYYGFVADVTEYTFNYIDYDNRGNEVDSGAFKVLMCTETPHTGFFEVI